MNGALDANLFIAQDYDVVLGGAVRGDVLDTGARFTSKQTIDFADLTLLDEKFLGDEDALDGKAIYKAVVGNKSLRKQ